MLMKKDGKWSVGSSWTSWIKSDECSDLPPEKGWKVRSGMKVEQEEFVLEPTLRLRFGSIGCQAITINSSGPIFQFFGRGYLGKFYKIEFAFKAGRPIYRNEYGKILTMIDIFGRVHYWTVHDFVKEEYKVAELNKNSSHPIQCFRLNLRRNICPALARGSDNLFLYRTLEMSENKIVADDTLSVTCDWHRH